MNWMAMRFKGFTWPVNPTALKLEMGRSLRETALPFAGSQLEDLGQKKRRVTGEGYFTGEKAQAQWQALGELFAMGGAGPLQLPGQMPFWAVMEELAQIGEPGGDVVHYRFAFAESKSGKAYKGGRTHRAAAGESLWDYAGRYQVKIEELHKANLHIRDIACLEQGEEVRVP